MFFPPDPHDALSRPETFARFYPFGKRRLSLLAGQCPSDVCSIVPTLLPREEVRILGAYLANITPKKMCALGTFTRLDALGC